MDVRGKRKASTARLANYISERSTRWTLLNSIFFSFATLLHHTHAVLFTHAMT